MSKNVSYPDDWQKTTLSVVADFLNGYPFKPRDWGSFGLPIVRIAHMTDSSAGCDYFADPLPKQYRIDTGDLLFSWSATLMAKIWQRGPAYLNQHIYKVVPRNGYDVRFIHHLLNRLIEQMANQSHGTTMQHITRGDMLPFPVSLPDTPEQSRIAVVLDIIDNAIAKSKATIEKLNQVRAGLLHDLLTRGLDEHGHLRDPIAHPEQFQDTHLGRFPQDWLVVPLGHFIASAEYGISTSLNSVGTMPVLRMNNITNGEASLGDLKFVSYEVSNKLLLRNGDVLFNRTNSYEHVGRTGIWRGQMSVATFASYLVRLNPFPDRLTSEFLNLLLNMPDTQKRMRRFATPAVQQVNINPTNLQKMTVSVPKKVKEQGRIIEVAQQNAHGLIVEEEELRKLISLKCGLMSDVLTGRVRVPETLKLEVGS